MRDIYVRKEEIGLRYNPKDVNELLPFIHPELLLNSNTRFLKCPEGFNNGYDSDLSSIVCKLLLTNEYHDGIWLIREDDKRKVSIPGGHMAEDVLDDIKAGNVYTSIYETLTRELIEENPRLSNYYIGEDANIYLALLNIIDQYGFSIKDGDFPLFYAYDEYNGSFTIYLIKEVSDPNHTITPFSHYGFRNMIWYSRKEHSINLKTRGDRTRLFDSEYSNDIRISSDGIDYLDRIFSTKNIFGNTNIY